jgi:hypothetical protein
VPVFALLGKTLLFLAGLPMLLDLIGPKKLRRWMENAKARLKRVLAVRSLVLRARPIEALTRKMARHAAREESLPAEDLSGYFTADQFAAWTGYAHAELAASGHDPRRLGPDLTTPEFERLAREFMLRNDRVPSAQRAERYGRLPSHQTGSRWPAPAMTASSGSGKATAGTSYANWLDTRAGSDRWHSHRTVESWPAPGTTGWSTCGASTQGHRLRPRSHTADP